jgi:hypothetical protein
MKLFIALAVAFFSLTSFAQSTIAFKAMADLKSSEISNIGNMKDQLTFFKKYYKSFKKCDVFNSSVVYNDGNPSGFISLNCDFTDGSEFVLHVSENKMGSSYVDLVNQIILSANLSRSSKDVFRDAISTRKARKVIGLDIFSDLTGIVSLSTVTFEHGAPVETLTITSW